MTSAPRVRPKDASAHALAVGWLAGARSLLLAVRLCGWLWLAAVLWCEGDERPRPTNAVWRATTVRRASTVDVNTFSLT